MIRRVVLSIALLLVLVILVHVVGGAKKSPAQAMLDPGNCTQPCWHGIQPGVTTIKQAQALFAGDPGFVNMTANIADRYADCWRTAASPMWIACIGDTSSPGREVLFVEIWPPEGAVHLGDVVSLVGEPTLAYSCPSDGVREFETTVPKPQWVLLARFKSRIKVTAYKQDPVQRRIDPNMIVYHLYFADADDRIGGGNDWQAWPGFAEVSDGHVGMCIPSEHPTIE